MSHDSKATAGCQALQGACSVDHEADRAGSHRAFGFMVNVDRQEQRGLGAELLEWDPEDGFPRELEVCVEVAGALLELKTFSDFEQLQERIHAFLQGLAGLATRFEWALGASSETGCVHPHRGCPEGPGECRCGIEAYFGTSYSCDLSVGEDLPQTITAQLFQGVDASGPPVVSIWTQGGLDDEVDADGARAYATRLRRMADGIDRLATEVDEITAMRSTAGVTPTGAVSEAA
ncbi:hypothetical protein ABZ341_27660 [Streptomyces sp. NPDC006173]|uniref:hypothetical protein n=1 Tax=Streptomyces sp. NPDC006173 TaxID=3155349 RepID=UPI0033F59296